MNILVTGASGFIGRRFIELAKNRLSNQDRLIALSSKKVEGVTTIIRDQFGLRPESFLRVGVERIDKVVHIGHYTKKTGFEATITGNLNSVVGTLQLLQNVTPGGTFVYISSMDVYGIHRKEEVDESSALMPQDFYAASKIMIELAVQAWAKETGTLLHVLRLSHIYGPGDKRVYSIPVWLRAAQTGEPIRLFTNPDMHRNCLYLDDCCEMMWNALFLEEEVGVINLASQRTTTMLELAACCKEISGNTRPLEVQGGGWASGKAVGLRFKNNDKARKYLGGETVGLKEGLRRTFHYYG